MGNSLEEKCSSWMEHVTLLLLFLAFFILTLCQTGTVLVIGLVGIILCMTGMMQPAAKVDLWILLPLIFYNVMSACSSYAVYGNFVKGFASTQSIFPVMLLLLSYLSAEERVLLKRLSGRCIAGGRRQTWWSLWESQCAWDISHHRLVCGYQL